MNRSPKKGIMLRRSLILLVMLFLAGGVGAITWFNISHAEQTPAIRGEVIARRLGCFACHGPNGIGGIPDVINPAGAIPGWEPGSAVLYVKSEQDIREWILHGKPQDQALAPKENDPESLAPMPAYADLLSEQELDDLVAFFKAVSHWAPNMPDKAFEGSVVAKDYGCFGCHGPSGMGGISNPGSFKGHIPPWDGEEYAELVENEAELHEWIMEGRIARLWNDPRARFFLERQRTQMPAYREVLSQDDLDKLVVYIQWLRGTKAENHTAESPIG